MTPISKSALVHDVEPGPLTFCQVCNSEDLELVIDLGHQPLCDSLLRSDQLNQPETNYPLRLMRCRVCTLAQLDYVVPGEIVFHRNYPYRAGITQEVVDHHRESAAESVKHYGLTADSLVVDIGSNDGTLLTAFKNQGVRVLGVEPTNIADIANANGIETIKSPFTESVATDIQRDYGNASLITATNVFAHMAPLGEVIRGIKRLLKDGGLFMSETHYLLDIIKGVQYDTIYHEHIRSYSLKSLVHLFEANDFTVVDAIRVERYAGTLRVFAAKGKNLPRSESVTRLLAEEKEFGLHEPEVYKTFRERSIRAKNDLLKLALEVTERGDKFVGNSCPGRCSTLLNFTGISRDLMPYIAEQPTSLKLGLYLPGKQIPVLNNEILLREQPDYVVLLAWHYAKPIAQLLRERGLKSKLVAPLPDVKVLDL
ncbi:MAG TPA: class I SAM-dependent methyltransferase [Pyrinomonadaceae bacterium]|jgi:SAM-dependent methyltransferase|nr:class I SAM-dependent methyltransferase [Pyrinomonadaceae bacterium]